MFFATNLQTLRKTHGNLSQETLADRMNVSRQTVSKWESGAAYPEVEKLIALSDFFHCKLDRLLREDLSSTSEAFSPVTLVTLERFRMAQYMVISGEPETDSIRHMEQWAEQNGLTAPVMIGCDVPMLSLEQQTVYGLRGYMSAVVLPDSFTAKCEGVRVAWQEAGKYARITIRNPFLAPFELIPNAYKTIQKHIEKHGIRHAHVENQFCCFEQVYHRGGNEYMDVYIVVDMLAEGGETVTLQQA